MTPDKQWPAGLPCVQFEGKTTRVVSPTIATVFATGRSRVRRAFTAVPVVHEVSWRMTGAQVVIFEEWFASDLKDGAEWFSMDMPLPQGDGPWAFQFVEVYEGPDRLAPDTYEIRAVLQQWLRPVDG